MRSMDRTKKLLKSQFVVRHRWALSIARMRNLRLTKLILNKKNQWRKMQQQPNYVVKIAIWKKLSWPRSECNNR